MVMSLSPSKDMWLKFMAPPSNMHKYLPSKKFTIIALISIAILTIILATLNYVSKKKENRTLIEVILDENLAESTTLNNLIQKDADGDTIPDWEEALWGTNPADKTTNDDTPDKDWISQRKKELAEENKGSENIEEGNVLGETDKFAREFFATLTALKQSGSLNESAVSNISNVLGDKIKDSALPETYSIVDISKTYDVTTGTQEAYYNAIKDLFYKYSADGLGSEFDAIDTSTGETDIFELERIGEAYQAFSNEVKELSVPTNLTQIGLSIINSAYNTGSAVKNLSKMTEDPIVGLIGLSQYQKYSEEFIKSSEELRTYLLDSGIIVE